MRTTKTTGGFTLAELLTVLAILAILCALLFPVFRAAKATAHRTVCISDFRQVLLATNIYLADYDDRFMPVNYVPSRNPDPSVDRTWVQLLLPYTSTLRVFRCPVDSNQKSETDATFARGVLPGDTYERYYQASLRVNTGYNYLYYSPVVWMGDRWEVQTRAASAVSDAGRATIFIDSVYSRDAQGNPKGGGSYVVIPPCRFSMDAGKLIDSFGFDPSTTVFTASKGWVLEPLSPLRYGFAWPWHDGRMSTAILGGGTKAITIGQLGAGCDVKQDWAGLIRDRSAYPWDLN